MSVQIKKSRVEQLEDLKNIPESLKSMKQFLLWSRGKIDPRTGKFGKYPKGLERHLEDDTSENPKFKKGDIKMGMGNFPLVTFDEAYNHLLNNSRDYTGLGFHCVNGVVGIDIDNCFEEDGSYTDVARDIVDIFDTYTERSPSGTGLRLFVTSNNPPKEKIFDHTIGLEIFHNTNFFTTVTGNIEYDVDIQERTEELDMVIGKYLSKKEKPKENSGIPINNNSNNKSYQTEGTIYEGQGRDVNLTSCVGSWLNSGTKDYYDLLSMALAHTKLRHSPPLEGGDVERIVKSITKKHNRQAKKTLIPPLDAEIRDEVKKVRDNIENQKCCDMDFENMTSRVDKHKIPWLLAKEIDSTGEVSFIVIPQKLAIYFRKAIPYIFAKNETSDGVIRYVYQDGAYRMLSDNELKGLIKKLIPIDLQKSKDINEVFNLLITDLKYTPFSRLNENENIVNFQNGLLDLKEMKLIPHTHEILTTIQLPCNWNPEARPSKEKHFDKFIDHLTTNKVDVRSLLLQFIGVCISNIQGWRMKKALFMVGEGDTGKSQLKELTHSLLGENNCSGIELSTLEARFGTSTIFNKRLIGSSDMSYTTVEELKVFKSITGGDTLSAEFKGKSAFEFKYKGLAWFCANSLPRFGGDRGDHVYERIIVVECNNPVPHKDSNLQDKMLLEKEYIIYIAINELHKVIKNGNKFIIPETSKKANHIYKITNNNILQFIEENIEEGVGEVHKKTLFNNYRNWCQDSNFKGEVNINNFKKEFINKGYVWKKSIRKGEIVGEGFSGIIYNPNKIPIDESQFEREGEENLPFS